MAVEKNPFDKKEETSNVVSINAPAEDSNVSFEVDGAAVEAPDPPCSIITEIAY